MPTYPYACTACDHRFEQVQAFSDPSLTDCPACGGRLRKVFSSVGIVFKGSGFYRNDVRAGAATSSEKASTESGSGSGESKGSSEGATSDSGSTSGAGSSTTTTTSGSSSSSSSSGSSSSGASGSSAKSA